MLMYLLSIFKITQCSQPGSYHLLSFPVGAISFFFIFSSLLFLLSSSEFFCCSHIKYRLLIPAVGGPYLDPTFKIKMSVYPYPFPPPLMPIRGISGIWITELHFTRKGRIGTGASQWQASQSAVMDATLRSLLCKNKMSWWSQSDFP